MVCCFANLWKLISVVMIVYCPIGHILNRNNIDDVLVCLAFVLHCARSNKPLQGTRAVPFTRVNGTVSIISV